jgi:hypothetical protein
VKLTNVPDSCIIDSEGKWFVIEPSTCKDKINVEKV